MTPYIHTQRYVEHVARLNAEKASLQQELAQLAGIKRGTRTEEQRSRRAQVVGRLKTIERNIAGTQDLSCFTWPDLLHLYAEACFGIWTPTELELMSQEVLSFEGRGEKPMRYRLGLPLLATQEACDLPGNEEIKYMGTIGEPIRIGQVGKKLFGRLARDVVRAYPDETFSQEVWEMLATGEISAGKVYHELPEVLRLKLQHDLSPLRALSDYAAIYLVTDVGFIRVPREDYSRAWSLACITQMSPKYRLKREYVETCLLATLSPVATAA